MQVVKRLLLWLLLSLPLGTLAGALLAYFVADPRDFLRVSAGIGGGSIGAGLGFLGGTMAALTITISGGVLALGLLLVYL